MDRVARELNMDRVEFRKINLFGNKGRLPNGQIIASEPMERTLDRALELFNNCSVK
jgi:CO/xanthine dehydrogenase Mo-binding subunit